MITCVAETSFKDRNGIYRKFNIQILKLSGCPYNTIVINLDGYDPLSCGITYSDLQDNIELFFKHLDIMFGIKNKDEYQIMLIENGMKYKRSVDKNSTYYGEFLQIANIDFEKEYKKFLEKKL